MAFAGFGYDPTPALALKPMVGYFDNAINRIVWMKFIIETGPGLTVMSVTAVKFNKDGSLLAVSTLNSLVVL